MQSPEIPRPVPGGRGWPDPLMRNLTLSANHGKLWFAVAGVLALMGKRHRRAAARGVGSLAGASLVSNTVIKPLVGRSRPPADLLHPHRQLPRMPWTSSFPSGHSASAAAFAVGAAMERPRTAIVLAPLAAAVAYSRVYVGVHYRTDVVAGAAIGTGVALAGHFLWPATPLRAADTAPGSAPALPAGEGLAVVVNPRSGSAADAPAEVTNALPGATIVQWDVDRPLDDQIPDGFRALGVAGGDGTAATVAQLALVRGLPLAVFPAGTLNHFARSLDLETYADTARAVTMGTAGTVDVGRIDGRVFLNTAGLGGYPEMVRLRERLEHRIGKWPAAAFALYRAVKGRKPVDLVINGQHHSVWAVFVGNGVYRPRGLSPARRTDLADGVLDLQYLRADRKFGRTMAIVASLFGTVERSRVFGSVQASRLEITSASGPLLTAHDGEVTGPVEHVLLELDERRLTVYR
ncbi:bifunctional phosphatase PAP2/diacylglycerol kinase family protein [Williamsia soli]|uniref:bifunctional phosphatase PAP2/diacylglycerol kinase family protein n=1 Tax=Williamsia soli TaxID=364929 RepID=UPI001A9F99BC|nr:phosphatase PAP2 family protein [Williamsia soli]